MLEKVLSLSIISAAKVAEILLALDGTRASNDAKISKIKQYLSSKHSILLDICLAVLAYLDAKVRTKLWRCLNDGLSWVEYCVCRYRLTVEVYACESMGCKCT